MICGCSPTSTGNCVPPLPAYPARQLSKPIDEKKQTRRSQSGALPRTTCTTQADSAAEKLQS